MAQLVQGRPADVPITTVDVVHREVGHQRKGIGNSRNATALGSLGHIELLDDFSFVVAEKMKLRAETRFECGANFRRVNADHRELTIVHRQFLLKFYVMVQLHLAFGSPITAVERDDQREFSRNL